ncbi:hypothetical protein BDW69DRAFT_202693 [Aspergillus filifer]
MMFNDDLSSQSPFRQLFSDWDIANYDESTYLAILDIVVAVSLSLSDYRFDVPDASDILIARRCLEVAHGLATCLKENNPELKSSRPYLRWVLAEEDLQRRCKQDDEDLRVKLGSYSGLTVWSNSLPIYVPINTENPTDSRQQEKFDKEVFTASDEILESVLDVAQDYATESLCLRELIYRSNDQKQGKYLTRIRDLQRSLQGDAIGAPSFVRETKVSEKRNARFFYDGAQRLVHRDDSEGTLLVTE